MKLAIIKTGGKQYKVKEGETIAIEKLTDAEGASVNFETLMTFEDKGTSIKLGTPSLGNIVSGQVISTAKTDKVSVVKFKNKTRYRRNVGHRQTMTKVKISKIA